MYGDPSVVKGLRGNHVMSFRGQPNLLKPEQDLSLDIAMSYLSKTAEATFWLEMTLSESKAMFMCVLVVFELKLRHGHTPIPMTRSSDSAENPLPF